MLILATLVFLSVTAGVIGIAYLVTPTRSQVRLHTLLPGEAAKDWTVSLAGAFAPFARLSSPEGDWETSHLRIRFLNAGIRRGNAHLIFFGTKTLLPLLFAAVAYVALRGSPDGPLKISAYILGAALIGCYLPNVLLNLKVNARKREIFENFPDAADLMLVCVEAGMGLDAALTKVTDEVSLKSRALAEEMHLLTLETRAGMPRQKALRNFALRTGLEEINTFAAMLTQSDRFGTSIGDSLRVFSDDLRHKRQMRAEEMAAKVPTKMLFPLVLFIFPSVIMVVLGPAIIRVVRELGPVLGGS